MKRQNAQTILFIVFILSFCQYGYAQYSIKFTTTDFENLCPDKNYSYTVTVDPSDSNSESSMIVWDIKGGIPGLSFQNSIYVKWNKTGSRSIKASAYVEGNTISVTKTITTLPFNYEKPTLIKVEKNEIYNTYYFFDRNKSNDGTMSITLPEGLADDQGRTGTFDMDKQFDPLNQDYRFIRVKYTQSHIEGDIKVVFLDKCRNAGAAEIVPVTARYLDNIEFDMFPSKGISYGSDLGYTFRVNQKSDVTYNWNLPKGWTSVNKPNTYAIRVTPSTNSIKNGSISVTVSAFGDTKTINCPYPGIVGFNPVLSGPDFICGNTTYTLSNVIFSSDVSTRWWVPSDIKIISKTNTSIVVAPSLSRAIIGDHASNSRLICAKISNENIFDNGHVDKPIVSNLTADLSITNKCTEISRRCIILGVTDNLPDPYGAGVSYKWTYPRGITGVTFYAPRLPNVSYEYNASTPFGGDPTDFHPEQENNTETPEIETRGSEGHFGLPNHPRFAMLSFIKEYTNPITITCTVTAGCFQKTASITIIPGSFTSFQVGPNPADNNLEIINNSWAEPATLSLSRSTVVAQYTASLYNEFGPVRQINIHPDDRSSSIQTADLPNGMYYLIIKNENQVIDNRIIMVKH